MKKRNIKVNAVLNVVKRGLSVLFPLITYTYVSRVLGSANLGSYSFAESIISYFNLIAALGISSYAIREGARIRNDKEKILQFSSEIFTLNFAATVISYLLLLLAVLLIPRLRANTIVIAILSVDIVANTLSREWLNSVFEDFASITVRYIIFQSISVFLILFCIRSKADLIPYSMIMAFSVSGSYLANVLYSSKRYVPIRLTGLKRTKKHLKPILYLFLISLTLTIYINSDITILGFLRSSSEVGIYTLASKIYVITKEVLNAITMVAIPRLSSYLGADRQDDYRNLLKRLREALIVLILPCIVGIYSLAKPIMSLIGGAEYVSGWVPLTILCFALFFAVFACFYAQGVLVPNRLEKKFLLASSVSAVVNIVLNLILVPYWGMAAAAFTTVIAEFIVMSICLFYSAKDVGYRGMSWRYLIAPVSGCFVVFWVCHFMKMIFTNDVIVIISSIAGSVIAYFLVLLILKNAFVYRFLEDVGKRVRKNKRRL